MNFKIKQGELTSIEQKDLIKMLDNDIGIANKNGNSYSIYQRKGERREVKICFFNEITQKKDIKWIIVMYNRNKKQVA